MKWKNDYYLRRKNNQNRQTHVTSMCKYKNVGPYNVYLLILVKNWPFL